MSTTHELLLELGTEEIPAGMAAGGVAAFADNLVKRLAQARLTHGEVTARATPRRLVVAIAGVAERQPDIEELVIGPPKSVAYGADGAPTQAGSAFAAKFGATVADIQLVDNPEGKKKGTYVGVRRTEKGRAATEILPELVQQSIAAIPWKKSMRWGDPADNGNVAFVRPMHWILALFGGARLPVRYAGLESGTVSRGHRFLSPGTFEVKGAADHLEKLRAASVLLDEAERRRAVESELSELARQAGGQLAPNPKLLDEVVYLVEFPVGVLGHFDERFVREIPSEVIVAAMTGHQRYFPLVGPDGRLLPAFATIAGTKVKDPRVVAHGNQTVIKARLEDGAFFFHEDKKHPLAERVESLTGMVFQAKLGTMRERADRISALAGALAERTGASASDCRRAGLLCKADLTTRMVGEFPDLQGVMGRIYAAASGEPAAVCEAIYEHYLPRGEGDALPASPTGRMVALADRLDALVGGFVAGLQPTGAGDPFGLRRAALGIVRILTDLGSSQSSRQRLSELCALAFQGYVAQGKVAADKQGELATQLAEFFRVRLRAYHAERCPTGLVDMILEVPGKADDPADLEFHLTSARRALDDGLLTKVAEPAKRARNITKDVKDTAIEAAVLKMDEERALHDVLLGVRGELSKRVAERHYYEAYHEVDRRLRDPLHAFFEKVFVMDEDLAVRRNRLALLRALHESLAPLGDFSRLGM
jgi:glycyl-tRNA synthetase beta chain